MMDRRELLQVLPPFSNRYTTIKQNQSVNDIVKEVLAAHEVFAFDYDLIAEHFDKGSNVATAKALFDFLKKNIVYSVEPEEKQTTKSPAALLATGEGDCKHYSGFIAGVLDALKRRGKNIDFVYRFASYDAFDSLPGHVFVVLKQNGVEYWIDPVLRTFNERLEPVYILDKKPKAIDMLQRVSGIEELGVLTYDEETNVPPEIIEALTLLYNNGILNVDGTFNEDVTNQLATTLTPEEFQQIADAKAVLHSASIGGFFNDLWRGVKTVTLAGPRNAFLGLVALNGLGLATKLYNCLFNKDGSYSTYGKEQLYKLWHDRLGGDFGKLENTIKSGAAKKAILGAATVGEPVSIVALLTAAAAVLAAMTPIINAILRQQAAAGQLPSNMDPKTGLPYGVNPNLPNTSGGDIWSFIEQNPLVVVAAAAGAVYFLTKKKRS